MKGLVVDRKGRYTVVLTGNGSFIKICSKAQHKIGTEIEFERPFQAGGGRIARITSIAAVFTLTLGLSYGVYSYTTPYSYVDFDINPSIELTANVYDIIIKAETFDEAGAKLLEKNRLNFKSLDNGIAALVDTAISEGYLKAQDENAVLLSVDSKDEAKKEQLEKNVENAAAKVLDESKVESAVISQQVPAQKREAAKDMGVSPGKLTLMEKARESDPELTLDAMKNDSVKEIMKRINENKKSENEKSGKNGDDKKININKDKKDSNSKKEIEDRSNAGNEKKQGNDNAGKLAKKKKDKEDNKNKEKIKDNKSKDKDDDKEKQRKNDDKSDRSSIKRKKETDQDRDKVKNISAGIGGKVWQSRNKAFEDNSFIKKFTGIDKNKLGSIPAIKQKANENK